MAQDDIYARVFLGSDQHSQVPVEETIPLNDSTEAEERAQQVLRNMAAALGPRNAWHGQAVEENRFYLGHQWDDIDRMRMEQSRRPAITFNEIKPAIDAISGLERLNRNDVQFKSRGLDSPVQLDTAGDLATEAVSTVDDMCNGVEELSRVAKDASIMGMGWAEIHMDYGHDINGQVIYERIPNDEMYWDPHNQRKENLEGREWCARKKRISRKKFIKIWGEDKLQAVDMSVPDTPFGQVDRYEMVTPYYSRANQQANPQVGGGFVPKKDIEVIQYQWRDTEPLFRFIDDQTGEEAQFNQEDWDRLKNRLEVLGGVPPPAVEQEQPVYKQAFYCNGVELEEPIRLPGGFSFMCLTGYWDEEKKRWVGLVRAMIDPQKTKNKALSAALEFHISNAKGGVLFKPNAFDDPRRAQDAWAQANAWIPVTQETNIQTDIVPRQPTQLPPELPMFYQEASRAITTVSGVNAELVGQATGQTPSQTAQGRVQAGVIVLGWFFDNYRRHHREKAAMLLEFVREYWSQGQFLQVGGDFNSQQVQLLQEGLPGRWEYSLVLDDSIKHNPNLKAALWRDMMESGVLQALMKFGLGQVLLQLLKFSPFPTQVVTEIQKAAMAAAQNPQPQQPGTGRGRQQNQPGGPQRAPGKPPDPPEKIAADIRLRMAQAEKAMAQAREIDARTGVTVPKLALEAMGKGHEINMDQQQHAHEQQVHQHERGKDIAELMLKGMGHQQKTQQTQQAAQLKAAGAFPGQQAGAGMPGGDLGG